ncbi:hypothetical protein, unlikely [Trypanosoma brucei gambiense DAL972]|uniref:Uncharacterized protein n=1 Tax=Trypanosoma brucei gambiense (strain MHOM/CI/86/DAL972) TaxID=679716 RepID=C9ZJ33_TRYB9|nr:hypothetical protein, unlikely [Trypanosoma brucei gambiense DAL972]CBH09391.1 hypothetical protein, unlikely [Trypanosoma brucei gambiense DAL972]|eukprot:XP_011771697.1 hypothetical protein, unlikely [Trypanosoma brucei gambiense DAL972]
MVRSLAKEHRFAVNYAQFTPLRRGWRLPAPVAVGLVPFVVLKIVCVSGGRLRCFLICSRCGATGPFGCSICDISSSPRSASLFDGYSVACALLSVGIGALPCHGGWPPSLHML